jgi:hypothetical protein
VAMWACNALIHSAGQRQAKVFYSKSLF